MKSLNVIDNVVGSNLSSVKKRLIVAIDLFDEYGNPCSSYYGARKEVVTVTNDVYTKEITERFNDNESYTEGTVDSISIYGNEIDEGNYDNFVIDENHFISLPNELLERFKSKVDTLELKFNGDIPITLYDTFVTKIMTIFPIIKIDLGNKTKTIIEFPSDQKFKTEGFSLTGGNINFKGNFRLQCDSMLEISNSSIYGTVGSVIELICDKPVLSALLFNNLVYFNVGFSGKIDSTEYDSTVGEINDITYIYSEYSEYRSKDFTHALLTVLGLKYLNVNNLNLIGADAATLISVRSIGVMNISSVTRIGKRICGNTVVSRSCVNLNAVDFNISCDMDSEEDTYVIKPDPSNYKLLFDIGISNFEVKNVSLIDLAGLTCGKVTVSNVTFAGMRFVSSENCDVNKLSFNNCKIVPGSETRIECRKLSLYKTDIQFGSFSDDSLYILGRNGITISDSYIRMDKSNIDIEIKEDCGLLIDNSYITCKNLDVYSSEDSEAVKMMCKSNSKSVKIKKSTISIYETFKVHDLIYSLNFESAIFNYLKKFEITGLTKFSSTKSYFEANEGVLNLFVKDCDLSNMDFGTNTSGENSNVELENCTGSFEYISYDTSRDGEECGVTIKLKNSKVAFTIDSNGMNVKAKINSSGSKGSIVWGNNSLITVVPNITSEDKNIFSKVDTFIRSSDAVNYGGSTSEKEFYL